MKEIIYKQDAIDAIKEGKNKFRYPTDALQYAENNIVHLPSAERKGKWIVEGDGEGAIWGTCSCCGMHQCAGELNFCPNCGARMEWGRQNED